jgi:curved DNA-binding protein CbpA
MSMQRKPVSYYEVLQITPQASDEDVKRAYRRLALHHHPDRHPKNQTLAELKFQLITKAYEALKTHELRAVYDQSLAPAAPVQNNKPSAWGWLSALLAPAKKTQKKRA